MPILRTRTAKKPHQGRVDFDPEQFRQAILQHGQPVQWEMVVPCPCVRVMSEGGLTGQTREPRVDCPECRSHPGFIYHSAQQITALLHGAKKDPSRFELYGSYAHGMASFTLLPEHLPAFLDRFTMLSSVAVYHEVRERTVATTERPRYPIIQRTFTIGSDADPSDPETVTYGVIYARRADAQGRIAGNLLVDGVDFDVTDDGEIDWTKGDTAGTAPVTYSNYAISYYAHPVYVVQNHPHAHRDTWIKDKTPAPTFAPLPVQADCWLEFYGAGPNG